MVAGVAMFFLGIVLAFLGVDAVWLGFVGFAVLVVGGVIRPLVEDSANGGEDWTSLGFDDSGADGG
jgi:hypothetical protein